MSRNNVVGGDFKNKAEDFSSPTQLPTSDEQRQRWQEANRVWWSSTPMRYDWREEIPYPKYSVEYLYQLR